MNLSPVQKKVLEIMSSKMDGLTSVSELTKMFLEMNSGARKASVVLVTDPKMRKTNNPYIGRRIKKISRSLVDLNIDYENKVNNQREREGLEKDFEATSNWHVPIKVENKYTPLCKHKSTEEMYLRAILDKSLETYYIDEITGEQIVKESLDPFLIKSKPQNQGLEKTVQFFTAKLSNIAGISTSGKTLLVSSD